MGEGEPSHVAQGYFYLLTGKLHHARMAFEDALMLDAENRAAVEGMRKAEARLERLVNPQPRDLYGPIAPRYRV